MDRIAFKRQILANAIQAHQSVIDRFKTRIEEMRSSEMRVNEDQFDYEERSFNETINENIEQLAAQLNFALEEMDQLLKIRVEEPLHDVVTFGSAVITNKRNFFVSISVESFMVDDKQFFGLSTKTPLYQEMEGKNTGEAFSLNGINYSINEIL